MSADLCCAPCALQRLVSFFDSASRMRLERLAQIERRERDDRARPSTRGRAGRSAPAWPGDCGPTANDLVSGCWRREVRRSSR